MANVKITTGQYVTIEQRVASVSDRVFAQILDFLFMGTYITLISLVIAIISLTSNNQTLVLIYILFLLPVIFYHPIFEYFFNGASLGKKILKIKVVHKDGSSPTLGSYLMRWIMYLVECLMMPGIALLCILLTRMANVLATSWPVQW